MTTLELIPKLKPKQRGGETHKTMNGTLAKIPDATINFGTIYAIEVTPSNTNFQKHIWKEGGCFTEKAKAEFQAKQLRATRNYSAVTVIQLSVTN